MVGNIQLKSQENDKFCLWLKIIYIFPLFLEIDVGWGLGDGGGKDIKIKNANFMKNLKILKDTKYLICAILHQNN